MAGRRISAIKIKKLRYGDVLTAKPTEATLAASFKAASEIDNSHQGTFTYEEAESTINSYKNELNGQIYRSDVEPGDVSINFTIGAYDFATKAALQGGTATEKSWERGDGTEQRYKAFYAITEDNVCIVFPKANIIGRGSSTDNAVGLAVSAIPQEASANIKSEYWFDVDGVDLEATPSNLSLK